MDITSIREYRFAYTRADLSLTPGEVILAGGTWLMSEAQPHTSGFVDISRMSWPDIEVTRRGLRIAATCTIARLLAWAKEADATAWPAIEIVAPAANALLASFKIWNTATVGGNICRSFAAGSMTSLAVALDAVAEIWCPDGTNRSVPVAQFVTGNGTNTLAAGEVLRAIVIPGYALRARARLLKIALAEHGRSGCVVTGRHDRNGSATFAVTAASLTPQVVRFAELPAAETLRAAIEAADGYYTDPLGAADWRRAMSVVLAERIRSELASEAQEATR